MAFVYSTALINQRYDGPIASEKQQKYSVQYSIPVVQSSVCIFPLLSYTCLQVP